MKRRVCSIFVFAGLFLLAGCSTPEMRIRANPTVFDRCTLQQQELIKQGRIAVGFDQEMVRLALGDPDRITTRTDASGESQIWIYVGYETDEGVLIYGGYYPYRRFCDPMLYPYYVDYPIREAYDRFRVVFKGNKVVAIEEESS